MPFEFLGVSLHKTFFLQYIHIYIFFKEQGFKNLMMQELTVHVCLVVQSCPTLCTSMDCSPPGSSLHGGSPGKNTGVGCCVLLQGSFQLRDRTQVPCIAG